jgi:alpha-tubulin suppressor-like RCC1 family protein
MNMPVAVDTSGALSGKTVLSIYGGSGYNCAIASDNQAYCWGSDGNGQLGNGATSGNQVSPVAVDTAGALSGKTILSISSGDSNTCAIASDNLAYCWGDDASGQLGNGATSGNQVSPVAVDTSGVLSGKTIVSISTGYSHTCAIASDNQAYCWGSDINGQLGNGATSGTQASPVAVDTSGVLSGKTILSISVGLNHTCAIASDNLAYCWGLDGSGQLGNGATSSTQVSPVAVDTSGVLSGKTTLSISASYSNTCAIASDNLAYCWGADTSGQLGNGATSGNQVSPVAVDTSGVLSGKTVSSLFTNGSHTCAIASDSLAYCWGADTTGQLGNGATSGNQVSPVAVDTSGVLSGKTILSISVGDSHTCAIASDNLAYCWGSDTDARLGNGATSGTQVSPVAVDTAGALSGKTVSSISAGTSHTCAIASDDLAYCWGWDIVGQLGNGAYAGATDSPVAVTQDLLSPIILAANKLSLSLEFAEKSAGSCSAQTGFADVTGSTAIAYSNNATPANGASITTNANDPISTGISTAQTYHETVGTITNPNAIAADKIGLWDFSLKDNSAPASTTYCLRLAGADGSAFGSYTALPEITTAAPSGPTLDQMTRGGASVLNGVKQNFSW